MDKEKIIKWNKDNFDGFWDITFPEYEGPLCTGLRIFKYYPSLNATWEGLKLINNYVERADLDELLAELLPLLKICREDHKKAGYPGA